LKEIAELERREIDFEQHAIRLPKTVHPQKARTKNREAHTVWLSDLAWAILTEQLERWPDRFYVFSGRWRDAPLTDFGRRKHELELSVAIKDWRLHDYRRSMATGLADLGVPPFVCEAMLNHQLSDGGRVKDPKVMKTYNKSVYGKQCHDAWMLWSDTIRAAIEGTPEEGKAAVEGAPEEGKVIPLVRASSAP
jgi:hypothetical protein